MTEGEAGAPQDESPKPLGQNFICSEEMSFRGLDGLIHARKREYEAATGATRITELRALGNKAVGLERTIDRYGCIVEVMRQENLAEEELPRFRKKWDRKYREIGRGIGAINGIAPVRNNPNPMLYAPRV
jgi:hypothetical protein